MHRIMLEMNLHSDNSFVTLTYDDEHLPPDGSLVPRDMSLFLKRLRKSVSPGKFRFFGVGEYGDISERPHYHLALFGFPVCRRGGTQYFRDGRQCCEVCSQVAFSWGRGRIHIGSLTAHSAQYVAGYVTKKMTRADDIRLNGRHPEFSRQSNRPGIGADFMHEVASSLLAHDLEELSDVPLTLRQGARELPLGRYLRRRLRELTGKPVSVSLLEVSDEVSKMLADSEYLASGESLAARSVSSSDGQNVAFEARQRVYGRRKDRI